MKQTLQRAPIKQSMQETGVNVSQLETDIPSNIQRGNLPIKPATLQCKKGAKMKTELLETQSHHYINI